MLSDCRFRGLSSRRSCRRGAPDGGICRRCTLFPASFPGFVIGFRSGGDGCSGCGLRFGSGFRCGSGSQSAGFGRPGRSVRRRRNFGCGFRPGGFDRRGGRFHCCGFGPSGPGGNTPSETTAASPGTGREPTEESTYGPGSSTQTSPSGPGSTGQQPSQTPVQPTSAASPAEESAPSVPSGPGTVLPEAAAGPEIRPSRASP